MRNISISAAATAGVLMFTAQGVAQTPVALVEDVRGSSAGVEFMDYVPAGRIIRLRSQDSLVLGYLKSCWSEAITGGTVTVGNDQSDVQGGNVKRTKVMCDGGRIELTAKQANQSAGTSFRASDDEFTLYGLSPVIDANSGAAVLIVRIDRPGEYHAITLPAKKGSRRSHFDFVTAKKALTAGGTYRASIGARQIVFKIDPNAKPGRIPIISRLLRFG